MAIRVVRNVPFSWILGIKSPRRASPQGTLIDEQGNHISEEDQSEPFEDCDIALVLEKNLSRGEEAAATT